MNSPIPIPKETRLVVVVSRDVQVGQNMSDKDEVKHFVDWISSQFGATTTVCHDLVSEESVSEHDLVIFLCLSSVLFFNTKILKMPDQTVFGKPFVVLLKDGIDRNPIEEGFSCVRYRNFSGIRGRLDEVFQKVRMALPL